MAFETVVWLALGAGVGGLLAFLGLGGLLYGLRSARNAYAAVGGAETRLDELAADGEPARARLSGTVVDVPSPVETVDGEAVALYRFSAELKDYRNISNRRRIFREQLADAVALEGAVLRSPAGRRCLLTAAAGDGGGWGDNQERRTQTGLLLRRTDFVSADPTAETTYRDRASVPDRLRAYLASLGAELDVDLDQFGVRGLTVTEDVVRVGDTLRVVGPVEGRSPDDEPPEAGEGTDVAPEIADGVDVHAVVALHEAATATPDSWRALARAETKAALVQVPMGLVMLGAAVVVAGLSLRNAGLL